MEEQETVNLTTHTEDDLVMTIGKLTINTELLQKNLNHVIEMYNKLMEEHIALKETNKEDNE